MQVLEIQHLEIKGNNMKNWLHSKTVWGLIGIAVPYIDTVYQYANALPEGMLPKKAALVISGLGWVLATYGRVVANQPLTTK